MPQGVEDIFGIGAKRAGHLLRAARLAGGQLLLHFSIVTERKGEGIYNSVVIGAGTAGLVTAAGTAGLGGRVALIERNQMGGD